MLVIGIVMAAVGLVWLGEGIGYIPSADTPRIMPLHPWTYGGCARPRRTGNDRRVPAGRQAAMNRNRW
jgi:hypothetical protein